MTWKVSKGRKTPTQQSWIFTTVRLNSKVVYILFRMSPVRQFIYWCIRPNGLSIMNIHLSLLDSIQKRYLYHYGYHQPVSSCTGTYTTLSLIWMRYRMVYIQSKSDIPFQVSPTLVHALVYTCIPSWAKRNALHSGATARRRVVYIPLRISHVGTRMDYEIIKLKQVYHPLNCVSSTIHVFVQL